MSELKLAVAGIGRMGVIHALHVHELARETGSCVLAALADIDVEHARSYAVQIGSDIPIFASIEELADAGVCNATVIVTPTENHREHATMLVRARHGSLRCAREASEYCGLKGDGKAMAGRGRASTMSVLWRFLYAF